jgi:hypothetical protein
VVSVLALVGATAAPVAKSSDFKPAVNAENFRRIRKGMTYEQVIRIFGRGPSPEITTSIRAPWYACWHEDSIWIHLRIEWNGLRVVGGAATIWDDDGAPQTLYLTEDEGLFAFLFRLLRW